MFYVYIIRSSSLGILYKGFSLNPMKRLEEHNTNLSKFTSNKGPWSLVYLEIHPTKKEALIREKQLKKYNHTYLNSLIQKFDITLFFNP